MSTDPLAEDERTQLATSLRWHFNCHAAEPNASYASLGIENAVLTVERILAAHEAQVRANERRKVAALLADESTVAKVAEAAFTNGLRSVRDASAYTSGADDDYLRGAADDIARAALDALAGLIGGEGA